MTNVGAGAPGRLPDWPGYTSALGLPLNVTTGIDNDRDTTISDPPDLANQSGDPRDRATYDANFTGRIGNLPRNFGRGSSYFEAQLRVLKFIPCGGCISIGSSCLPRR